MEPLEKKLANAMVSWCCQALRSCPPTNTNGNNPLVLVGEQLPKASLDRPEHWLRNGKILLHWV